MENHQIIINGTSATTEKRNGHLSCDQREPSPLILGESFLYWWNQHCGNYHYSSTISWNYGMTILGDPTICLGHKVSDVCANNLSLTSFPTGNTSNLVLYKAGTSINVSGNFIIPQGVHVIFDAPIVTFSQGFTCPVGATFETRNEGCEL